MGPSAESSMEAPLHEGSGGHDNVAVVAGHGPRLRGHIAVHRCSGLDALAEGTHGLPAAQFHRLNDIPAHLPAAGNHTEAQRFIASRCKDSALYRGGHHCGSQKQPLIETGEQTQIGAHLLAEARCTEPIGAAVDEILPAADIAAGGSQTATQILNEGFPPLYRPPHPWVPVAPPARRSSYPPCR